MTTRRKTLTVLLVALLVVVAALALYVGVQVWQILEMHSGGIPRL